MGENDYYAELILGVEHFLKRGFAFSLIRKRYCSSSSNDALLGVASYLTTYSEERASTT